MTVDWVHPGLLLIAGAWLLPLAKGRVKRALMLLLPAARSARIEQSYPGALRYRAPGHPPD